MLGFLLGTACIVGIVAVVRGRYRWGPWNRFGRPFGCGPREFAGGAEYYGWGRRSWRSGRRGGFQLRRLFERLETTPGQEKVFTAAAEQLRQAGKRVGEELAQSRREVAQVLRAEQFNPAAIREIFARHDLLISDLRAIALDALSKVDEALDDRQRKLLADLIESEGNFYRGPAAYGGYV